MRTTIKDIAKETGLSVTTVSLVLNDKPHKVAQATRRAVLETAKKMNYIPNQMARGLVNNNSKMIGVIVPDITNVYFAEMAKSILSEARKYGFSIMLCDSDNDPSREAEHIQQLYQNGIAALIMASTSEQDLSKESVELIKKFQIKAVFLDRNVDDFSGDCIVVNQCYGSYMATRYLLELGHTKIGCITGPRGISTSEERLKGMRMALDEYDIKVDENRIYRGDYQLQSGIQGAKILLSQDVTAIYAFNDMMAYGVFKVAVSKGLSIPKDLSIMGFDDIPFSDILQVPLATVSQPVREMGKQAVKRVIEKIENEEEEISNQIFIFKPTLIKRASVAKCL